MHLGYDARVCDKLIKPLTCHLPIKDKVSFKHDETGAHGVYQTHSHPQPE